MTEGKAIAGLIELSVGGTVIHVRQLTQHDLRCWRGWRSLNPDAPGWMARAWILSRVWVDPETGGRLFDSWERLADEINSGFILAASAKVMELVPDN